MDQHLQHLRPWSVQVKENRAPIEPDLSGVDFVAECCETLTKLGMSKDCTEALSSHEGWTL